MHGAGSLDEVGRFLDLLLRSPVGARVVKVLVFGSAVKGTATPDSDVDLLIVTRDGEAMAREIDDILLDFQMESSAPLEIVTCALAEIVPPADYFLLNVLRYGKEVYSMPPEEIKRAAVRDLAALAREYLQASEDALGRGHLRLAADGGYNAAELAVKALILLKEDDLPGSHGAIVQRFGALYVQSGEVDREMGRQLNTALRLRNAARYRYDAAVAREDVQAVMALANRLLDHVAGAAPE